MSGGNELVQYRLAGTYIKETTVFSNSFSDEKAGFNANLNIYSANKKLNLQFAGNFFPIATSYRQMILLMLYSAYHQMPRSSIIWTVLLILCLTHLGEYFYKSSGKT